MHCRSMWPILCTPCWFADCSNTHGCAKNGASEGPGKGPRPRPDASPRVACLSELAFSTSEQNCIYFRHNCRQHGGLCDKKEYDKWTLAIRRMLTNAEFTLRLEPHESTNSTLSFQLPSTLLKSFQISAEMASLRPGSRKPYSVSANASLLQDLRSCLDFSAQEVRHRLDSGSTTSFKSTHLALEKHLRVLDLESTRKLRLQQTRVQPNSRSRICIMRSHQRIFQCVISWICGNSY